MLDGPKLIGKEPKLTSSRNLNQTFSHCQQLLPYTKSLEHLSGKQHCILFLKLQHQSKDDSSVAIGNLRLVIKSMIHHEVMKLVLYGGGATGASDTML